MHTEGSRHEQFPTLCLTCALFFVMDGLNGSKYGRIKGTNFPQIGTRHKEASNIWPLCGMADQTGSLLAPKSQEFDLQKPPLTNFWPI